MMNIKPLGNRVLVAPEKEEEVTSFGLVLADTVEKKSKAQGKIVALGNGKALMESGLKVGDTVLYKKWGGEEIKVGQGKDEVEYKVLYVGPEEDKNDIIAVIG